MRAFVVALVFMACDVGARPASYNPNGLTGIEATSEPALDPETPRIDLAAVDTTTGGEVSLSTSTTGSSGDLALDLGAVAADLGGGDTSTGEAPGSTSAEESSGTSSSTGEPEPPDVCGDGVCTGAETEPACWGAGFCPGDCLSQPKCLSDCPCSPGISTFCNLAPGTCSATKPGGYCDPDGDGAYFDGDFTKGALEHDAKCG